MSISMEAIHRLRESINDQLDHLVDEIEHQHEALAIHGDKISQIGRASCRERV